MSGREWEKVLATNLEGSFNAAQAVYPYMAAQRRGKVGSYVCV